MDGYLKKTHHTISANIPHPVEEKNIDLLQDGMAFVTIIAPLIITVGFFFTIKAKTVELEKAIGGINVAFKESLANAHDILLLKIDAKLAVFSERMDVLKGEIRENAEEVKDIRREMKKIQNAKQDILNQLSRMGIDLYVIGENDRRSYPKED